MTGHFDVKKGRVHITDPCYSTDTWCGAYEVKAKSGHWIGKAKKKDGRIGEITVFHKDHVTLPDDAVWLEIPAVIGVDSGQCGVFDALGYPMDDRLPDGHKFGPMAESFYELCCNATIEKPCFGYVGDIGFVSESGYGDGSYMASAVFNDDSETVAIRVVFL